jgi:hypothetical protein
MTSTTAATVVKQQLMTTTMKMIGDRVFSSPIQHFRLSFSSALQLNPFSRRHMARAKFAQGIDPKGVLIWQDTDRRQFMLMSSIASVVQLSCFCFMGYENFTRHISSTELAPRWQRITLGSFFVALGGFFCAYIFTWRSTSVTKMMLFPQNKIVYERE